MSRSCCGTGLCRGTTGCTAAYSVPYELVTFETIAAGESTPLSATPYNITLSCASSVAVVFSGTLFNGDTETDLYNATVNLSYYNVLTPSLVVTGVVPVSVSLPAAPGAIDYAVPVTVSMDLVLAAGTYAFSVIIGLAIGASSATELSASGTLNIHVVKGASVV